MTKLCQYFQKLLLQIKIITIINTINIILVLDILDILIYYHY